MPTTAAAAFSTLHSWLTPTPADTTSAISHRKSIDECLKANFGMTSMFRTGSFGYGTSISGFSDVDYMAVIPAKNLTGGSNYILGKVKEALQVRFPRTAIGIRNPAVVVPFGTGQSEKHEITPGFYIEETNNFSVYGISDRANGWMRTSPHAHGAWINVINDRLSKEVKPLIRFIKLWNYTRQAGIRSFYIEMRVAEYAASESTIIHPLDILRALKHLRSKGLAKMQDPMGIAGYIPPCTDAVLPDALSKLDTAIGRAERAWNASQAGELRTAYAEWKNLYNGYFPEYG